MIIKQTSAQLIRYVCTNALIVTFAVALGTEISGIIHQDYLKIFTLEYAVVFIVCFLATVFFSWLTAKKHLEINVNDGGLTITSEQGKESFTWNEVENSKRPSVLLPRWVFELSRGNKIKLPVNIFNKSQTSSLNKEIQKYV